MKKPSRTFRCPQQLVTQAQKLSARTGQSFSEIEDCAVKLYIRHLKRRGNKIIPDFTLSAMKAEERYLGRFLPEQSMEDVDDSRPLF